MQADCDGDVQLLVTDNSALSSTDTVQHSGARSPATAALERAPPANSSGGAAFGPVQFVFTRSIIAPADGGGITVTSPDGGLVSGSTRYDAITRTLAFVPSLPFEPGVTMTAAARPLTTQGAVADGGFSFTFSGTAAHAAADAHHAVDRQPGRLRPPDGGGAGGRLLDWRPAVERELQRDRRAVDEEHAQLTRVASATGSRNHRRGAAGAARGERLRLVPVALGGEQQRRALGDPATPRATDNNADRVLLNSVTSLGCPGGIGCGSNNFYFGAAAVDGISSMLAATIAERRARRWGARSGCGARVASAYPPNASVPATDWVEALRPVLPLPSTAPLTWLAIAAEGDSTALVWVDETNGSARKLHGAVYNWLYEGRGRRAWRVGARRRSTRAAARCDRRSSTTTATCCSPTTTVGTLPDVRVKRLRAGSSTVGNARRALSPTAPDSSSTSSSRPWATRSGWAGPLRPARPTAFPT